MMTCREVAERGSEYLDQELPLGSRLWFRLHLMLCRPCRGLVDGIHKVIRASSSLESRGDPEKYEQLSAALVADDDPSGER